MHLPAWLRFTRARRRTWLTCKARSYQDGIKARRCVARKVLLVTKLSGLKAQANGLELV